VFRSQDILDTDEHGFEVLRYGRNPAPTKRSRSSGEAAAPMKVNNDQKTLAIHTLLVVFGTRAAFSRCGIVDEPYELWYRRS